MTDNPTSMARADDARLRQAFAAVAEVAGAGSACPSTDALWESAAGRSGPREREAVILHLAECTACAAAWRLARDLCGAEPGARILPGRPRWFRENRVQVAAIAAVLVFGAALAVQFWTTQRPSSPAFRGQEGDWIHPLVPEAETLPRASCLLRWTPGPTGTVYDVRVTTEDLVSIARSRGSDRAEFLVPPGSLTGLPAAARIVWQVTAHLPDGRKVDSRSFVAQLR